MGGRGIRDLRDIICVSRLTCHESGEEFISDDEKKVVREVSQLSFSSNLESPTPRNESGNGRVISPDSGFVTNSSPSAGTGSALPATSDIFLTSDGAFFDDFGGGDKPPISKAPTGTALFTRSSIKKKKRKKGVLPTEPSRHELPKALPLPPVASISSSTVTESEFLAGKQNSENESHSSSLNAKQRVNFDEMLTYMDATIVASWLTRSNNSIHDMSAFCLKGDNFVKLAHFWLNDFPDIQKRDIFSMEHEFLLDELNLAFAVGRESGTVSRKDLLSLCGAVFKEYPAKLLGAKGPHLFLNYLDIFTSEKHAEYRTLLSDVKCSTTNRQYVQWILATRSFALLNVWTSIINFYRNLTNDGASQGLPIHEYSSSNENLQQRRMLQAIRLGYTEVIHYLIVNKHVDPQQPDSHGRSLVFSAVMHNQPDVVKYLIKRVQPPIEINIPADTGNTALHAAANSGNLASVELICQCPGVDLNCVSPYCERATPLHLAAMHGHEKIVACLLHHGADASLRMGTTSVRDLARDFDHSDIVALLDTHSNNK